MVQKYAPAGLPVYFRDTPADSAFCKSKTEKGLPIQKPAEMCLTVRHIFYGGVNASYSC